MHYAIYYCIDYAELVTGKDLFYGVMQHYRSHRPQVRTAVFTPVFTAIFATTAL